MVLLVVAIVGSVPAVIHQSRLLASVQSAPRPPLIGSVAVLPGQTPAVAAFMAEVRAIVPRDDAVRVIQQPLGSAAASGSGTPGVCYDDTSGHYYWVIVYELLPRPVACSPATGFWVYYGVKPGAGVPALPAGSRVVLGANDLILVHVAD